MKKLISMILCLSTAFALSACAELDAIRNTELPPLPTPEVRATEEPAPVEIESAPEASRETPKPAISALPVDVTGAEIGDRVIIYSKKTTENLDAPDGSLILSFSYVTPTVRIDERPDAAKAINEQLVLFDEAYISGNGSEGGKNHLLEEALDNYTYVHDKGAELNTTFTSARTVKSLRADGSVLSFRYWTSVYTGGKSGSYSYYGYNFSTQTGEKLTLDKLSPDVETLKSALGDRIISVAREDEELYSKIAQNDFDADSALRALVREGNWYFDGDGMVFFPEFGELMPEENSFTMFTIPYELLAGVIDDRYLPAVRKGTSELEVLPLDEVEDGTVWSIDRLALSEGDELYLKISGTAYDVTVSNFYYVDEADPADRFYETERHWYASFMTDCALQIRTAIPGGMPDLMIAYTDADYVEHRLFLSENSDNGHVTLVDDSIEAVG